MLIKKIYDKLTSKRQHQKDLWFYVKSYGMKSEVNNCIKQGMSLEEAMEKWDIYPFDLLKYNN